MKHKKEILFTSVGLISGIVIMWFFGDNIKQLFQPQPRFKPASPQAR